MKRIGESKESNIQQLMSMSSNLRCKYMKHSSIQVHSTCYLHDNSVKIEYWLYVEDNYGKHLNSWKEVLKQYRILMKG